MENEIVKDIVNILDGAFTKKQTISLHEVLWTIDAKHHLIPSLRELNFALELVGGAQKSYHNLEVKLSQSNQNNSDYLIKQDINKAMVIYNQHFKN